MLKGGNNFHHPIFITSLANIKSKNTKECIANAVLTNIINRTTHPGKLNLIKEKKKKTHPALQVLEGTLIL